MDSEITSPLDFQLLFLAWGSLIVVLFAVVRRNPGDTIALPLAFYFAMAFEYIGAIAYAVPGYTNVRIDGDQYLMTKDFRIETVLEGLKLTTIGMAAFVAGVAIARPRSALRRAQAFVPLQADRRCMLALAGLTAVGFATLIISLPLPMIDAFAQVGRNAAIAYVCLGAAMALSRGDRGAMVKWFLVGSLIPFAYLVLWGFMSYGFLAFTFVASFFTLRLSRIPTGLLRFLIATLVGGYGLLSVFVVYMSYRVELRQVLWSSAGFFDRLSTIFTTFGNAQLLNPFDFSSLDWLTIRLNQAFFVGKVIEFHAIHENLWLNGESLVLSFVAWIPRPLWPGKPEMGGSEFLSTHTGLDFASGVSFGAGQVIEFYVNFGTVGVIGGFFALGLIVQWIDCKAGRALSQGKLLTFAKYATIGLAFVRPLSDTFFIVNTAIASFLVFRAIEQVIPEGVYSPKPPR